MPSFLRARSSTPTERAALRMVRPTDEATVAEPLTTDLPPLQLPKKRFEDEWAAATFLREQSIARGMSQDMADRIDQHCNCESREYAIPEYCGFLSAFVGITPDQVYAHIR